jgi:uncharacterized protein YceH (UPF0502 family)
MTARQEAYINLVCTQAEAAAAQNRYLNTGRAYREYLTTALEAKRAALKYEVAAWLTEQEINQ